MKHLYPVMVLMERNGAQEVFPLVCWGFNQNGSLVNNRVGREIMARGTAGFCVVGVLSSLQIKWQLSF